MKLHRTEIARATAICLATVAMAAHAQTAPESANLGAVTVTGIRASMEKSLETKRAADGLVEVVSAEDVGKMPDRNLADSLQRLSTVAVRTDYDEAEKVSMRGTNPDMSLILFNGHSVSGGDWYIADQQSSSRSTSLSLMPSSVLNQALVYRTSQANVVDGGLAGTINVTTRKPLAQRENLGGVVSVGMSYAALPNKTAPDLNASINWKNDEGTLGAIVQMFSEKRFLRRDSVTRNGLNFGWTQIDTAAMRGITDASLAGTGLKASDLNGVRMPSAMGTEFVEGVRDRKGGMLSLQWKPTPQMDLTLTSLQTNMNANNYGRSMGSAIESMLRGNSYYPSASAPNGGTLPATRVYAYIRNPVIETATSVWGPELKYLKSAEIVFPNGTKPMAVGNADNSYRDGASASSGFTDLDFKYQFSDRLTLNGLLSTTRGVGETKEDQGIGFVRFGTGFTYALNGLKEAPDFAYIGAGTAVPVLNADGSGFQANTQRNSASRTVDQENSLALNLEYEQESGPWTKLEVGVRHADHRRNFQRWVYTRKRIAYDPLPTSGVESYPSDFGSALGGNFDKTGFYYNQDTMQSWIDNQWKSISPEWDRLMSSAIDMREQQSAIFAMQNFESGKLSGNVGVRSVRTLVNANVPISIPTGVCAKTEPGKPIVPCAKYPTAIVDAANLYNWYDGTPFNKFGGTTMWYLQPTEKTFWNLLPSVNLRYELDKNMVLRLAGSKTIGRQNYNVWGGGTGTPTCRDGICTVTGPNPELKPMTSENFD
ncbi:MAG: TonB-dependent receptor, partial [Rhodoferax sp.]|nr:TonB-dependent receptor [Rhodoferax sp.]